MFTRNQVQAACLQVNRDHLALAEPQAVVINSGVANAATGERGKIDAIATAAEAAALLGLDAEEVLVLSTGVIGARLPLHTAAAGARAGRRGAVRGRRACRGRGDHDDRHAREGSRRQRVTASTIGGMAKGSGMIHPELATMLAVITTDYPLEPGEALEFLRPAVEQSFNAISVDGEPSTNDCVILLANGASGRRRRDDDAFAAALGEVCAELARQVVADGEGITVLAEINVTGAADDAQAKAIARRIATSPLVKTALFGHDANWGRVLMAAGSAPWNGGYAAIEAERITLRYNGTVVLDAGAPTDVEPDVSGPRCTIDLDLGLGDGTRRLPDDRSLLRLRPDQRGLPNVS